MTVEKALGWFKKYANGFIDEDGEKYSKHSFDLTNETSDTLISFIESKLSEESEQENCTYCHLDENLQCTQEWFAHPEDNIEIGLSCGGAEIAIQYKNGEEDSVLVTQGRYCPYCGRRI